jgi:proteic killer suppression protein
MIRSCPDKDARRLLERKFSRRLQSIEKSARVRLEVLDSATSLRDLDLPGFRLEALKGDGRGSTVFESTNDTGYASRGRTRMLTTWR